MQQRKKTLIILALVATLSFTQVSSVYATETIDDGVRATCDEAYYATMDFYGNLQEGSIVKSYITNGNNKIIDYGKYDSVNNLTNSIKPSVNGEQTTFDFGKKTPSHFYFEGKTKAPFYELPWVTEIHYRHNGVMAKAEDLLNQSGMFDIVLDFKPNENASEYAKNNYVLAATTVFNQDDILSLEAQGAQVQLVGNLRTVLFLVMPGEEQHFTISVGSEDFTFAGMTFLIVPATLQQLQDIAKLSENKDKIEENYRLLDDSLDTLLNSFDSMSGSLREAANGLDELNEGREIISKEKGGMYADADIALDSLDSLAKALDTMPSHVSTAQEAVTKAAAAFNGLNNAADDINDELQDIKSDLKALNKTLNSLSGSSRASASKVKKLGEEADKLKEDYEKLLPLLADLQIKIGSDEVSLNPSGIAAPIKLSSLSALSKNATSMSAIYNAVSSKENMTEEEFLMAVLMSQGYPKAKAKSIVVDIPAGIAAVKTANPVLTDDEALEYVLLQSGVAAADIPASKAAYNAFSTKRTMFSAVYSSYVAPQKPYISMNKTEFLAAMTYLDLSQKGLLTDPLDMPTNVKATMSLAEFGQQNTNLADAMEMLGYNNGIALNGYSILTDIGDTSGNLATMSNSAKNIIEACDDAIDSVDEMNKVIQKYAPELNSTLSDLKNASTALSTTTKSTQKVLNTFEKTLKKAGTKLDSGTQKSLKGFAATLRSAAGSLDKTTNVKIAKNNISDIIEDIWDDYTGDVNRLLLMNADAPKESLTDSRNEAPTSIQIMLRSQEITKDSVAPDIPTIEKEKTTFWGRISQMFKDLFGAVAGIFN